MRMKKSTTRWTITTVTLILLILVTGANYRVGSSRAATEPIASPTMPSRPLTQRLVGLSRAELEDYVNFVRYTRKLWIGGMKKAACPSG